MSIKFPLSPTRSSQQSWHSHEFRRLSVIDFVLDSLSKGKSVSIYASDYETWEGIEELRELAVYEKSVSIDTEFFKSAHSIRKDIKDILEAVSNSSDPLFGKQTFWELASLFHGNTSASAKNILDEKLDINGFDFTVELYKKSKSDLGKAAELYTTTLIYQLNKSSLRRSSFINEENETSIVAYKYVVSFLKRAKEIGESLQMFFERIHSSRSEEFELAAKELVGQVELWKEMKESFGSLPSEDFMTKVELLFRRVNQLGNVRTALQATTPDAVMEQLGRARHAFDEKLRKESVMLNSRNAGDDSIVNVEIDLAELLKDINNSQLFREETTIHTLSLSLKLQSVNKLVAQLTDAAYELRQGGEMTRWLSFYDNSSDSTKALINALKEEDKESWEAIFDSWFLHRMLMDNGLNTQLSIFSKINSIQENWERIRFDFTDIAKMFMNEKNCTLRIFPVENLDIQSDENALVLGEVDSQQWQELCMKSDLIFGLKPKENRSFTADDSLHESLLTAYVHEDELESKLMKSKLLAAYLVQDSAQLELLLAPHGNVIIDSAYSDVNVMIKDKLSDYKQAKMRDNGFKVLTEFFLNEAERNYYYYDQTALRFNTAEDIYAHISKINALQLAGYYTIAIDRNQLCNPSYISRLLSEEKIHNA